MIEINPYDLPIIEEKCDDCGTKCGLGGQVLRLLQQKGFAIAAGEALMGPESEEIFGRVERIVGEESIENTKDGMLKSTGQKIEDIDEQIAQIKEEMAGNSRSCSGVLKMRASRDDVSYTVAVCTSQRQYIRDGKHSHLPTHIWARSANDNK